MFFDIIYSITAHESPECIKDLIENIAACNKGHTWCCILNGAPSIQAALESLSSQHVYLIPNPTPRTGNSYGIFGAHIQNGMFCKLNAISGSYFIPLASNCLFWRHVTLSEIRDLHASAPTVDITKPEILTGWHWPVFQRNTHILNELYSAGLARLFGGQHEGAIMEFSVWIKICDYIQAHRIQEKIQVQCIFEEFLIHSLHALYTKTTPASLCKVFWELPSYMPSISHIESCTLPCVKRIDRNNTNPQRVWIRQRLGL